MHVDASYANGKGRRSVHELIFLLGTNIKEMHWVRNIFHELKFKFTESIVYCDDAGRTKIATSTSTIVSKNKSLSRKTTIYKARGRNG